MCYYENVNSEKKDDIHRVFFFPNTLLYNFFRVKNNKSTQKREKNRLEILFMKFDIIIVQTTF